MSEAHGETSSETPTGDEAEFETPDNEDAGGETEASEGGEGDEGEGDKPRRRAQTAEEQLHNLKGQNAAERSRRRAAERQLRELGEQVQALQRQRGGSSEDADELMQMIAGLRDDEDDPVGDIAAVKKALKAFRARQIAETEVNTRQTAVTQQIQKLGRAMTESEAEFAQDFPDYHDAAKFYREQKVQELEDAGYAGQALQRKLADDLYGVVRMSIENGLDPAERVYQLAKRRGFKAGPTAADKKVDVLKRAGEAGRRPAGQGPGGDTLSWEDVAKLDGAARDKAFAKLRARETARR